jgi:hypothetical protein
VRGRVAPVAALAIVVSLLAGCAATQEAGKRFPAAARQKLVVDRTPTREAERLLGAPLTKTTEAEGRERWTYEYTRVSAQRAVPFGRRVTVSQTPYERLVLTFRNGVLTECSYAVERYRTEDGVIVPDGSSREACGAAR